MDSHNISFCTTVDTMDAMNAMFGDMFEVTTRMDSRRILAAKQQNADADQADLCDRIKRTRKLMGLDDQIRSMRDNDPVLYRYIQKLEFINFATIWCNNCAEPKEIHVDENLEATETAELNISDDMDSNITHPNITPTPTNSLATSVEVDAESNEELSREITKIVRRQKRLDKKIDLLLSQFAPKSSSGGSVDVRADNTTRTTITASDLLG